MRVLFGILIGLAIFWVGWRVIAGVASSRPREEREDEPENVESLDVVFVCGECGTQLRVERLGELQIPRHCGEPMHAEQRPRGAL